MGRTRKTLAALLAVIMTVALLPTSVFAEDGGEQAAGSASPGTVIIAFAPLESAPIAYALADAPESQEDLPLPATLAATVEGETDSVEVPVTWAAPAEIPYIAAPGSYIFTAVLGEGYALADGLAASAITVTVKEDTAETEDTEDTETTMDTGEDTTAPAVVTGFAPIETTQIEYAFADAPATRDALPLPATLAATVEGETDSVAVPVTWTADNEYTAALGRCIFTAAPGEGYALAEGLAAPTFTITVSRFGPGNSGLRASEQYIDESGTENTENATVITSDLTAWSTGWYVTDDDVTISDQVTVNGDVNLILKDGASLSCLNSILVAGENSLAIYGQSDGSGVLNAAAKNGYPGIGVCSGDLGTITINGGVINATGSFRNVVGYGTHALLGPGLGRSIDTQNIITAGGEVVIRNGHVTATGGDGWSDGSLRYAQGIYTDSFLTGANGTAFVKTNGISDTSKKESWSGIIFEGSSIGVYGNQTRTADFTIDDGCTLSISSGSKLSMTSGAKFINNGTFNLSGGTFESEDALTNNNMLNAGSSSMLQVSGEFTNTKNVTIGGTVTCDRFNSSELIQISEGGTLVCNGGTNTGIINNKGTLTNTGTISGDGGIIFSETDVQGADGQLLKNVNYLNEQGEVTEISAECAIIPVTSTDSVWQKQDGKTTWYIVAGDITIGAGVALQDDINLLLMDGVTLTVNGRNDNGGINAENHTLNIYAQSNGPQMGKLVADGGHENWMAVGGHNATVNIYGGWIEATEGYSGIGGAAYRSSNRITISGGLVKTNGIGTGNTVGGQTGGLYAPEGSNAIVYTDQAAAGSDASNFHGILFLQKAGIAYGSQELAMDLTIEEDESLTIPEGTTLTVPAGKTLTIKGTLIIKEGGALVNGGKVTNDGEITNEGTVTNNPGSSFTGDTPSGGSVFYIYSVTFDANGGTGFSASMQTGTDGKLSSLPAATRDGYSFDGWFTAANGGVQVTTDYVFSANTTVYAQWMQDPVAYTVTFDANGGAGSSASMQTGTDGRLSSLPTATRSGYSFDGWFTAASGGTQITTSYVFGANTTVYAQWTQAGGTIAYTVTFDANGGTGSSASMQTGTDGRLSSLPTATRSGYSFDGWYTAASDGDQITTDHVFSTNTTVYAHWVSTGGDGGGCTPTPTNPSGSFSGNSYVRGSASGIVFTVQKDFSFFGNNVRVNNAAITRNTDYTAESGSTKITLLPAYLDTLQAGTYTLTVNFTDGTFATGSFTITASATTQPPAETQNPNTGAEDYPDVPQTSDNSDMGLWYTLLIASVLGIAGIIAWRKKQTEKGAW